MNGTQLTELEQRIRTDYSNIAGMVVRKDGKTVYEGCFGGCTPDSRIHVFSVTKSIVSILFGIALDKGFLDSIDRRVLDFYPEYTCKRGEKTIQQITIRDMLAMTAPYKYKSTPYTKYFTSPDWVKFSLDLLGGKGSIGGECAAVRCHQTPQQFLHGNAERTSLFLKVVVVLRSLIEQPFKQEHIPLLIKIGLFLILARLRDAYLQKLADESGNQLHLGRNAGDADHTDARAVDDNWVIDPMQHARHVVGVLNDQLVLIGV